MLIVCSPMTIRSHLARLICVTNARHESHGVTSQSKEIGRDQIIMRRHSLGVDWSRIGAPRCPHVMDDWLSAEKIAIFFLCVSPSPKHIQSIILSHVKTSSLLLPPHRTRPTESFQKNLENSLLERLGLNETPYIILSDKPNDPTTQQLHRLVRFKSCLLLHRLLTDFSFSDRSRASFCLIASST